MARTLTTSPQTPSPYSPWGWASATFLVVALHALALAWLSLLMQPPSLLKEVGKPFYTRTIAPQVSAPVAAPAPAPSPDALARTTRPTARLASAEPAKPSATTASTKSKKRATPERPRRAASATEAASPDPKQVASESEDAQVREMASHSHTPEAAVDASSDSSSPSSDIAAKEQAPPPASERIVSTPLLDSATQTAPTVVSSPASAADAVAAAPAPSATASASAPAFLASWPSDTRLRYRLGGNYRGELHGDAEVLWQREGTSYQAVIQLDVGILLSSRFTSQGDITERGLRPRVYEEQVRKKRRGVKLGDDVRLDNGERVPRPEDIQDAASQFVELGHRFATRQVELQPGGQINFWLARPGGVDEWTYDMVGEETIHLPRLGAVRAVHLKPRPLAKPRGPIAAEIWFAPSLQYLPVRIRITSGPDTFVDLMVETIEQK